MGDGYIARVKVHGREMCSKAGDAKGERAAQRELDCLWKIYISGYADALGVPNLLGLIETTENNCVIGFLEEYIPVSPTRELSTLASIENISAIDKDRRMKWALQLQDTIRILHKINVTWGDAKASNVLIHHETDDA